MVRHALLVTLIASLGALVVLPSCGGPNCTPQTCAQVPGTFKSCDQCSGDTCTITVTSPSGQQIATCNYTDRLGSEGERNMCLNQTNSQMTTWCVENMKT
jgi:hypothetical protein